LAAGLAPQVTRVTLKSALTSWHSLVSEDHCALPDALTPNGVLKHFDPPEVDKALKAKRLTQSAPWGAKDGMGA